MKYYIHRLAYRLALRQATPGSLTVLSWLCMSVCLLVYVSIDMKQTTKYKAQHVVHQQPIPSATQTTDMKTQLSGSRAHSDVSIKRRNLSEKYFSSPFVVTDSEQGSFGNTQGSNAGNPPGRMNGLSQAVGNKTLAIVGPCKGHGQCSYLHRRLPMELCPFKCQQTWALEEADVVVFNVYSFKHNHEVPHFTRPRHQRWVMSTVEAPVRRGSNMLDFPAFRGQFNWTMTYRLDSDIPRLYGKLERWASPAKDYDLIYRGKSVTSAWFVSHCISQSQRHVYVQRMQQISNVHVYGSCGNYTCRDHSGKTRDLDKTQCLPLLSKTYFFYLAFENSLCKDYVTEKFFKVFQEVDVIPVVRGGSKYKEYFPNNTFVDASDFKSPEELALFLLELARDKQRYISMLKEKSGYRLLAEQAWFCDVCQKMHTDARQKSYPDLRQWYLRGQCHQPNDM